MPFGAVKAYREGYGAEKEAEEQAKKKEAEEQAKKEQAKKEQAKKEAEEAEAKKEAEQAKAKEEEKKKEIIDVDWEEEEQEERLPSLSTGSSQVPATLHMMLSTDIAVHLA